MKLNGWQRIELVLIGLWFILVFGFLFYNIYSNINIKKTIINENKEEISYKIGNKWESSPIVVFPVKWGITCSDYYVRIKPFSDNLRIQIYDIKTGIILEANNDINILNDIESSEIRKLIDKEAIIKTKQSYISRKMLYNKYNIILDNETIIDFFLDSNKYL